MVNGCVPPRCVGRLRGGIGLVVEMCERVPILSHSLFLLAGLDAFVLVIQLVVISFIGGRLFYDVDHGVIVVL